MIFAGGHVCAGAVLRCDVELQLWRILEILRISISGGIVILTEAECWSEQNLRCRVGSKFGPT